MNQKAVTPETFKDIVPYTPGDVAATQINRGQAMTQVQTKHFTAVRVQVKRRSLSEVAQVIRDEADLAGKGFYYRWMAKGKDGKRQEIIGPTKVMAQSWRREWGNCAVDVELVGETSNHWMFKAYYIDLQNGQTEPRLFQQYKHKKAGKMDKHRTLDIQFQIGQTKAIRNATLQAIPGWLVDQLIERAQKAELAKLQREKNLPGAIDAAVTFLAGFDLTEEQLEDYIGLPRKKWTAKDVLVLKELASSLKAKRVFVEEIFDKKPENGDKPPEDPNAGKGSETPQEDPPPASQGQDEPKTTQGAGQNTEESDPGVNYFTSGTKDATKWRRIVTLKSLRKELKDHSADFHLAPEEIQQDIRARWGELAERTQQREGLHSHEAIFPLGPAPGSEAEDKPAMDQALDKASGDLPPETDLDNSGYQPHDIATVDEVNIPQAELERFLGPDPVPGVPGSPKYNAMVELATKSPGNERYFDEVCAKAGFPNGKPETESDCHIVLTRMRALLDTGDGFPG